MIENDSKKNTSAKKQAYDAITLPGLTHYVYYRYRRYLLLQCVKQIRCADYMSNTKLYAKPTNST